MEIGGQHIQLGEEKRVIMNIAKLPSHALIDISITVYRAKKPGPVLLLLGGLHGDEINGIEIVRKIIDENLHRVKRGSIIAIPVINIYGFINFSRELPDGKDINRSFPGNRNGSLASRVANFLVTDIIPKIDFGIDFHTGGASRSNYPQIRCVYKDAVNQELAKAFHAPFTINSNFRQNSLRQYASKKGKKILVYEGGESLRFDHFAIQEGIAGTKRLMKHLGMITEATEPEYKNRIVDSSSWMRARTSGLFKSEVPLGARIYKNETIGTITDTFGEYKLKIPSRHNGYVLGVNHNPVVLQGDALMHIGWEK